MKSSADLSSKCVHINFRKIFYKFCQLFWKTLAHSTEIIWANLVDFNSLMLYTNIQTKKFCVLEKIFMYFFFIIIYRHAVI